MPHTELEERLIIAIDDFSEQAIGSDSESGELSRQRALALDSYGGKNIEPAPEGRSQVVDQTPFEVVQWIMPSLMRIFTGDANVVEFDPMGPDDEEAAEQESFVLNAMVTQKGDWELIAREWMQDGLISKNAYIMVSMEEKLNPEIETYENQREEQIALLLEDDVEIVGQEQFDDPDDEGQVIDPISYKPVQDEATLIGALAIYQDQGIEPVIQKRQLFNIQLRRTKPTERLAFNVLPPERCRIAQNCPDFTLEDCDYFEYWDAITLSELRRMGYDLPDDAADDPDFDTDTVEDTARNDILEQDPDLDLADPSMKEVIARWIWIKYDSDEDGIAELQHVVRVGSKILDVKEVSTIPVACIVPFINTHRHTGDSVVDKVFDIWRIKTAMTRSMLDGLNLALNPRHAVSDKVNIDDMLTSRPGGLVRLKTGAIPGEGHILPLPTENTFPYGLDGLRHMDTVIESRVGVNRIFQGIDESALNDHNRIGQLSTMAAQRVEDIARTFAIGFKRLFKIAHELVVKSGHAQDTIKLRGEWVDIDPSNWRTGRDMRITAPFAAGNKDALVQRLMLHLNVHREALASGAPFVQLDDTYELAKMLADATDVPADKIYTDPRTVPPQEPPPDHTMIALEVENKKADNEAADEERKAQIELQRIATDAEVKERIARINSETQIALAQLKAGQQVDLEQVKANLRDAPVLEGNAAIKESSESVKRLTKTVDESISKLNQAVKDLQDASEAEREVVRENGRVVGVRVNGKLRKVKRDSDGRVTGA